MIKLTIRIVIGGMWISSNNTLAQIVSIETKEHHLKKVIAIIKTL